MTNGNDLTDLITEFYNERNLKFPNSQEALAFVHTELGEVYELLLSRVGGWTRNNPETKPKFSKEELGRELGDAIMMLIVAGMAEGVDPLKSLEEKIRIKMGQASITKRSGEKSWGTVYPKEMNKTTFTTELTIPTQQDSEDGD